MISIVFLIFWKTRKTVLSYFFVRRWGQEGGEAHSHCLVLIGLGGSGRASAILACLRRRRIIQQWPQRSTLSSWRIREAGITHFAVLPVCHCGWLTTSGQVWNKDRWAEIHITERQWSRVVHGLDLKASSAGLQSLSLHIPAVCIWPCYWVPLCLSFLIWWKRNDDDDDDNSTYLSVLFWRLNESICIKCLELHLACGRGLLLLLGTLHGMNRRDNLGQKRCLRFCFPGSQFTLVDRWQRASERLVQVRIVRRQEGGREPWLLNPWSLCSLCSHTCESRQRCVMNMRHHQLSHCYVTSVGPQESTGSPP